MGALLLGILVLVLAWLLPMPYVLWVILVLVGAGLILYGIWLLIPRGPLPPAGTRRRMRWY